MTSLCCGHANGWITPATLSLAVLGRVRHPLILSAEDVAALPVSETACAGYCDRLPMPATRFAGRWRGVRLSTLLDEAEPLHESAGLRLHAHDGRSIALPLAWSDQVLLPFADDGLLRLIAPGLAGCDMLPGISRIEVTNQPAPEPALAHTFAWLDAAGAPGANGQVLLRGMAFAGREGLSAVLLRANGGPWLPLPIRTEPFTLVSWAMEWMPSAGGRHIVEARAQGADGQPVAGQAQHLLSRRNAPWLREVLSA